MSAVATTLNDSWRNCYSHQKNPQFHAIGQEILDAKIFDQLVFYEYY